MPILRGEVYFIDLGPGIGREQAGRRPVVVASSDRVNSLPLTMVVVPETTVRRVLTSPWNFVIPAGESGLTSDTLFMAFQARAVDHGRFRDPPRGALNTARMAELERTLLAVLDLRLPPPAHAPGGPP